VCLTLHLKAQKHIKGIATYYAEKFQGRRTATGEIFKQSKLTAASNNFKLGSLVEVTNVSNGKSVLVRINDRMHPRMARMGRVVDLTRAAFNTISSTKNMLLSVKVSEAF
jgi:rare lipoprotein A